jgi:Meckel syndrome type 1 protein
VASAPTPAPAAKPVEAPKPAPAPAAKPEEKGFFAKLGDMIFGKR